MKLHSKQEKSAKFFTSQTIDYQYFKKSKLFLFEKTAKKFGNFTKKRYFCLKF